MIDSLYEVTHTFNEEESMLIAIAAIALEFSNSSESGSDV